MTPASASPTARLYLVCDARPRGRGCARRCAAASTSCSCATRRSTTTALLAAARAFRAAADEAGALFILNDRPDLGGGVRRRRRARRPGRRDARRGARARSGPERIVGRSTHAPAQADAARRGPDVDYLAVGPVHATPTKPGRPAAGLDYVAYAART